MIKQTAAISIDIGHSNLKIVQTAPDGRIRIPLRIQCQT